MSIVSSQAQDKTIIKNQRNMSGLSFLQSMSDITSIVRNREDNTAYVRPIEKHSVSKLNEKSLEMCTESLGTETGSESGDELTLLALEATAIPRAPSPILQEENPNLLVKKSKSFPPPIKFVKGSKYNRMVRSLGDDGRVVVQAIRVLSPPCCFVAERSEGRLRLSSLLSHNHEEEEDEAEAEEDEIDNNEKFEGESGNKKLSRLNRRCNENGHEAKPMLISKQHRFCCATN